METDTHPPKRSRDVAVLAVMAGLVLWTGIDALRPSPAPSPTDVAVPINPNCDPWWALAALPDIGETLGRRIVAWREAHPEERFRDPQDLRPIAGMGPVRIAGVANEMSFGECPENPLR
jgi:hypothetical protein